MGTLIKYAIPDVLEMSPFLLPAIIVAGIEDIDVAPLGSFICRDYMSRISFEDSGK